MPVARHPTTGGVRRAQPRVHRSSNIVCIPARVRRRTGGRPPALPARLPCLNSHPGNPKPWQPTSRAWSATALMPSLTPLVELLTATPLAHSRAACCSAVSAYARGRSSTTCERAHAPSGFPRGFDTQSASASATVRGCQPGMTDLTLSRSSPLASGRFAACPALLVATPVSSVASIGAT